MTSTGESQIYHGNCHCGRFRFEVTVPEIKDAVACTCTLCSKKGYLWLLPPPGAFEVVKEDNNSLTEYQSATLRDQFCNHCGTGLKGEHLVGPLQGQLGLNIRALQGVSPFDLESSTRTIQVPESRAIGSTSAPSAGPASSHISSCHCGKVQAELLVPIETQEFKEDNCSICVRNAYIGVYPTKDQVRIRGRENTFEYKTEKGFTGGAYCATCGVHMFTNVYGPPLSTFDALPPERRDQVLAVYWKNMGLQPLNVRTFGHLDPALIKDKISRTTPGTEGYVLDP